MGFYVKQLENTNLNASCKMQDAKKIAIKSM
jgi:hypothetical protein